MKKKYTENEGERNIQVRRKREGGKKGGIDRERRKVDREIQSVMARQREKEVDRGRKVRETERMKEKYNVTFPYNNLIFFKNILWNSMRNTCNYSTLLIKSWSEVKTCLIF